MYIRKKYSIREMAMWTRHETLLFIALSAIPVILYEYVGWTWLQLPWTPIALIGTAAAFLVGFQSNSAYGRAWEARKIWGGIVNESRNWAIMVRDLITNEYAKEAIPEDELDVYRQQLAQRHIAWLTALRHAMRRPKPWETFTLHRTNREWYDSILIPERDTTVEDDLALILPDDEYKEVLPRTNKPAAILSLQSQQLRELKERGFIWDHAFLEFERRIRDLLSLQGQSERIKTFPYPRQYATLTYDIVRVFIILLPFGIVPEFSRIGATYADTHPVINILFVWAAVPFTACVSWVFHTMQRIGIVGENPFEGSANDVPISTISRAIEIDMHEILESEHHKIPEPLQTIRGVQM